jgi:hypothetical protein
MNLDHRTPFFSSGADVLRVVLAVLFAVATCGTSSARAQGSGDPLSGVRERLDPGSYQALQAIVDSARAAQLPTGALVSKVQEGLLKRAAPGTIVIVTRGLLGRLRTARATLGPAATAPELDAAAGALSAGATPAQLAALQASRGNRGVAVPFVVLADLIARGVPRDTAARALQVMTSASANDAALQAFRTEIERDIRSGISPASAVMARSRAAIQGGRP